MPRPAAGTVQPVGFDPDAAFNHLRAADPVMARLIGANDIVLEEDDSRDGDHYAALIRAIVGQQLSTTVARVMWGRMLERFGGQPPAPEEVLADDPEELRAAIGLSRAKVSFLRSLAEHIVSGDLDLDHVATLPDDELIRELTAVKGIGDWSAHMFLMFQLKRPDVLAWGDLGVRKGAQIAYDLEDLPHRTELEALAEPWSPYRTAACRILWWTLNNEPA
jgi:DNA-3-methyladenine glycosylase II